MSTFATRIVTIKIPVDKIRDVIGTDDKMIRSIIERTGVKIDVEDNGTVNVASGWSVRPEGDLDHPGADGDARAEQGLHGQGSAHHRLRRVRRDQAGH
jgi:predicted PilT family ATPase